MQLPLLITVPLQIGQTITLPHSLYIG